MPGSLTVKEKMLDAALGRIEMRSGTDGIGALIFQGIQHQKTCSGITAAVVNAREDVTVKVDHSSVFCSSSLGSTDTDSSTAASRKAFFLLSEVLELFSALS